MNTSTALAPSAPAPVPATRGRLDAVDIARGLALIGMVIVHLPYEVQDRSSIWEWILTSPGGRASVLFFVLSGASLSIISGRGSASATPSALVKRGVVLFLFGQFMVQFWMTTILPHYGVMFMLAPLLLHRSRRALVAISAGALIAGPVLVIVFRNNLATVVTEHSDAAVTASLLFNLQDLLFGLYPLVLWIGFFTIGLIIGRADLSRRSTGGRLLVAGVVLALAATLAVRATAGIEDQGSSSSSSSSSAVGADANGAIGPGADTSGSPSAGSESAPPVLVEPGTAPDSDVKIPDGAAFGQGWESPDWRSLVSGRPHADTTFWALQALGVALATLGALIVLPSRMLRLLNPLRRIGTISLSAYVVHTFFVQDLWVWLDPISPNSFAWEVGRLGIAIALLLTLGWFVTSRWKQGPLEWGLHQLTRPAR